MEITTVLNSGLKLMQTGRQELRQRYTMNLKDIISGKFLSEEGVTRRLPAILYIVFLMILYIFNIFDTQKRYRNILEVEREIARLKVTATTTETQRVSATREANIKKMVKERGLPLIDTDIPPKQLQ